MNADSQIACNGEYRHAVFLPLRIGTWASDGQHPIDSLRPRESGLVGE
jgi:hypothetical protein